MVRIYFVRHAQPDFSHFTDLKRPLTDEGKKDAEAVTEFFKDKEGFEVCETEGNYGYPMVICSGECNRAERPLACRIFPLFPLVWEEEGKLKFKVIRDPRAMMCPIVTSSKRLDPKFVRAVRKAARHLVRDEKILDYMKNVSLELLEIIELQAMLEEGEG